MQVIALVLALAPASASPAEAAAAPAAAPLRSIAVLDVQVANPADRAMAALLTSALAQATAEATKAKVIAADEVRGLIDAAAAQALIGCEDARCTVDRLRSVLAVDEIVVSRAGTIEDRVLVFVSLVDARTATVLARASTSFALTPGAPADAAARRDVLAAAQGAAAELWSGVAAQSGDRLLAEMRIALVFDEAVATVAAGAAERPSEKLRAVESCVQDELVRAGVALIAPDSVAALKGHGAAALLGGDAPPFLTTGEVDALVVSRVEYTSAGAFAGAERVDADMSLRLVQVDTGTIIAAKQLRQSGSGFNANAARKEAAKKLCADVKPVLAAALDLRRARGSRVVVDVKGAFAAGQAELFAAELQRVGRVARVRVTRFDEGSATLEVIVAGGDGVSLALDVLAAERTAVASAPPRTVAAKKGALEPVPPRLRVTSASASALRLAR